MNELIQAAKAVIADWDRYQNAHFASVNTLRAAVEKTENPPIDYNEWTRKNAGKVLSAHEVWTAAQQADRARIKQIITYQFGELVSDLSEVMEMIDDE